MRERPRPNRGFITTLLVVLSILTYNWIKREQSPSISASHPQPDRSAPPAKHLVPQTRLPHSENSASTAVALQPAPNGARTGLRIPATATRQPTQNAIANSGLAAYGTGRQFTQGEIDFEILSLQALPKEKYQTDMGSVVAERRGFVLIPHEPTDNSESGFPVLRRKSNGRLAFLTGTILVTLKPQEDPLYLAKTFGIQLIHFDPSIQLAYFHSERSDQWPRLIAALKNHPFVISANLEIIHDQGKRF